MILYKIVTNPKKRSAFEYISEELLQSSQSIPFYSKYVTTGKWRYAIMKLHKYLLSKEFAVLNISHSAFPSSISVTPAEYSHLGGDTAERLDKDRGDEFAARDSKTLGHKCSMLSTEELMDSAYNEQSSYLPELEFSRMVKSC